MTQFTPAPLPECCCTTSRNPTPCLCCQRWMAWIEARDRERDLMQQMQQIREQEQQQQQQQQQQHQQQQAQQQQQQQLQSQQQVSSQDHLSLHAQQQQLERQSQAHPHQVPSHVSWSTDTGDHCHFESDPSSEALDVDCCPLEREVHRLSSRRASVEAGHHGHAHGQHINCMHDDSANGPALAPTTNTQPSDPAHCVWPALGSPFLDACPTTPALSLCAATSTSCLPTLSLSQQFLAAASGMSDAPSAPSAGGTDASTAPPSDAGSGSVSSPDSLPHLPVACPEEQSVFHHHHHLPAAHVHCNEEQTLAAQDEALRQAHVHTTACNPQVHYQCARGNVLHDHTVPLLATQPDDATQSVKTEGATPTPAPNYLPCSRVHTFPPPNFRFHPYASGAALAAAAAAAGTSTSITTTSATTAARMQSVVTESGTSTPTGGGSMVGSGAASVGGSSVGATAGAAVSNCHQCKVKKYSATVIQCTAVHEVTVRRSKPMCCVQKKKCAKKYCTTCLFEHDARVLTDQGFLFLAEIEERLQRGDAVRYACYERATLAIVYRSGKLVYAEAPELVVNFTESSARDHWSDETNDFGTTTQGELDDGRVSIRVTPNHDMFVQFGEDDDDATTSSVKIPAEELTPDYECDCASRPNCVHTHQRIRMTANATHGVSVEDVMSIADVDQESPVVRLQLRTEDQLSAFLELYGVWIGTASVPSASDSDNAVVFTSTRDTEYLPRLLARVGLARGVNWTAADEQKDGSLSCRIVCDDWVRYFDDASQVRPTSSQDASFGGSEIPSAATGSLREQAFHPWVLQRLDQRQMRLLLQGMRFTEEAPKEAVQTSDAEVVRDGCISASSVLFREQLLQACLHAGYSAHFTRNDQSESSWRVHYTSLAVRPSLSISGATGSSESTVESYSASRDGRVWCVAVDHPDALIVAQRAHANKAGVVTKASRPIVIGNCLNKHYGLQIDQLDRATWVCPGCLGHCNCAACTNKSRASAGGMIGPDGSWIPDALLNEMQTTHTHHQHLHTHAHTTTYSYAAHAHALAQAGAQMPPQGSPPPINTVLTPHTDASSVGTPIDTKPMQQISISMG